MFDTSNYPTEHSSGIATGVNKKVFGKFKDECVGKVMADFVGLRAKLYEYKMDDFEATEKAKGVKKKRRQTQHNLKGLQEMSLDPARGL